MDDPLLRLSFGNVAETYHRVRPPYSRQLLDRAQAALALDVHARVLDLAAGTGRLTHELAQRFADVVAVEPDERMRAVHGTALAGSAEAIPLADASCDLAFLYFVLHHFESRRAAGLELARVVRPGGTVCIRTLFSDRLGDSSWRRFFPRALEIESAMFPSLAEATADLAPGGLEVEALDEVTFELLSDEEVEQGLAAMEREAAVAGDEPVVERGDLLVLRRS